MTEQDHRFVDRVDDGSYVLGLQIQRVHRKVVLESGTEGIPPGVVGGRPVDEHEWLPASPWLYAIGVPSADERVSIEVAEAIGCSSRSAQLDVTPYRALNLLRCGIR